MVLITILIVTPILPYSYAGASKKEKNGESKIIFIIDSLRKDTVEKNKNLFLNKLYSKSDVYKNMYTPFPATAPTMGSILSTNYPYKFEGTSMFPNKQINLDFIKKLNKQYKLAFFSDYACADVINKNNFNIPFDHVSSPKINRRNILTANFIKKIYHYFLL